MRYTALAVLTVLVLAGCGGSSSPGAQASALLAKTGASSSGPAYMVAPDSPSAECSTGAAEADGTLGNGDTVNACVFPSAQDVASFVSGGDYAASAGLIQVGTDELVLVISAGLTTDPPPSAFVQSIASRVGGTVYS